MDDRAKLSKRTIPFMVLSDGSASSKTATPAALAPNMSNEDRAKARFAVAGNVIVTGGAGVLGLAAARALLEHGASGCCLWDLETTLRTSQAQIVSLAQDFPSARIFGIAVDVMSSSEVADAATTVANNLGSIDHLFCFAGIVGTSHAVDTTEAQWEKILAVNSTGSFLCAQAVAKQMIAQKTPGSITLIASISGHKTNFPQPQVAYNASKAAVLSMKGSLAAEWAVHGIRVNSISPGYMDTVLNEGDGLADARALWFQRTPMGRMGAPEELNGTCVLLASKAGSFITGADFLVDGGLSVF